jgi:hypothetical protein
MQRNIRVVKPQPTEDVAPLINSLFTPSDTLDTIRLLCVGISAFQKLELLKSLLQLLGWESVTVFGDCFDEVTLLDPVKYPGAVKIMAREICRWGAGPGGCAVLCCVVLCCAVLWGQLGRAALCSLRCSVV